MTEVRGDWLPATLRHLDAVYEQVRDDLPATRKPSEYWQEHCLMALSFVHKAEVAMRHEIGVETIAFGRDFPHAEGTWPNTRTGCATRSRASPTTSCGSCWARTRSG